MLNDGENKLEAMFSAELHDKLAGGAVKPNAVRVAVSFALTILSIKFKLISTLLICRFLAARSSDSTKTQVPRLASV